MRKTRKNTIRKDPCDYKGHTHTHVNNFPRTDNNFRKEERQAVALLKLQPLPDQKNFVVFVSCSKLKVESLQHEQTFVVFVSCLSFVCPLIVLCLTFNCILANKEPTRYKFLGGLILGVPPQDMIFAFRI